MTGKKCCVCGNTSKNDPSSSLHRIPKEPERRALWLSLLEISDEDIKSSSQVCSRHFPEGDCKNTPSLSLGKRFASPIKQGPRAKRVRERDEQRQLRESSMSLMSQCSSRSVTPRQTSPVEMSPLYTAASGEQLRTDYVVHELPESEQSSNPQESIVQVLLKL